MKINKDVIAQFLTFLNDNPKEIFTFAFLDPTASEQVPKWGIKFYNQAKLLAQLDKIEFDYTLHVCLNRTDLKGRRTENVKACRVLCVDFDDAVPVEKMKRIIDAYNPHLIVESSPNKYHLYWKLSEGIALPQWKRFQLGLAWHFSADMGLSQLAKTIRVPGVSRLCKNGTEYEPAICHTSVGQRPMSESDVVELFPSIIEWSENGAAELKKKYETLRTALKTNDFSKLETSHSRNVTIYTAIKYYVSKTDREITVDDAYDYAISDLNPKFSEPLSDSEVSKTVVSAHRAGSAVRERRLEKLTAMENGKDDLLDELPPVAAASSIPSTNGTHPKALEPDEPFKYDYDDELLRNNRFTDLAVGARMLQRYEANMVKLSQQLYAFNNNTKLWCVQSCRHYPEVQEFAGKCSLDVIHDPKFAKELCISESGEPSIQKMRRNQEKFLSFRIQQMSSNYAMNSTRVKKISGSVFDAHSNLLYLANGVLNMDTLELRSATPKDYMLQQSSAVWDETASYNQWLGFINSVFAQNDDCFAMVNFMQELFGYTLSAAISEQKVFCHHGDGCNGKSNVLYALHRIAGDYSTYVEPGELVKARNSFSASFERFGAKIEGRRCVLVDDVDVTAVWNEATLKNLTTNEIRARAEYEKSRTIANRATLHLGLNVAPKPEAENYGILRRLCFIPYAARFKPSAAAQKEIETLINAQRSGILRWAVEGYQRWAARGRLPYPKESDFAVEEYRQDNFKAENLLESMFEVDESQSTELHFIYQLVEDVNRFAQINGSPLSFTSETLGHALKRTFRVRKEKKYCKQKQNSVMAVRILLKYKREDLDRLTGLLPENPH